jgi:hypothetical protein
MKDMGMGMVVAKLCATTTTLCETGNVLKVSLPAESSAKVQLFIFEWDHHLEA